MSRAAARRPLRSGVVVDTTADGRGVVRGDGKTVFVQGALTGETVEFRVRRRRRQFDEAELVTVREASPERVETRSLNT